MPTTFVSFGQNKKLKCTIATFLYSPGNIAGIGNWHLFSNPAARALGLIVGCQRVTESVSHLFFINNVFYVKNDGAKIQEK